MSAGDLASISQRGRPVVLIHFNNACYGWIKMLQKLYHGQRYFGVDFDPDTDYVAIARGFGLEAERVEDPDGFAPALTRALASEKPFLLDVVTAPETQETPPVHGWTQATAESS
jgi:acetolactate synthase-1/2/3 large subunit